MGIQAESGLEQRYTSGQENLGAYAVAHLAKLKDLYFPDIKFNGKTTLATTIANVGDAANDDNDDDVVVVVAIVAASIVGGGDEQRESFRTGRSRNRNGNDNRGRIARELNGDTGSEHVIRVYARPERNKCDKVIDCIVVVVVVGRARKGDKRESQNVARKRGVNGWGRWRWLIDHGRVERLSTRTSLAHRTGNACRSSVTLSR